MNAADRIAALAFWDRAKGWVTRANLLIVAVVIVGGFAYCAGQSNGKRSVDESNYRVVRDLIVDTLRIVNESIRVDTVRIRAAVAKADTAQHNFAIADSAVRSVADTSAVIHSSLVLPALHTCELALSAKDDVIQAQSATIADALHRGNLEQQRADSAESQLARVRPRFGFKSGLLAGAGVLLALLHVAK
jgi:hypothetical protein